MYAAAGRSQCTVDILGVLNLSLIHIFWKNTGSTDGSALSSLFVAMSKYRDHNSLGQNNGLG